MCVCVCVGGVFPLITSEDNRQTTLEWLQPALTYRQCEGVRQSDPSRGIQIDYDDNNDAFQGLVFSCSGKSIFTRLCCQSQRQVKVSHVEQETVMEERWNTTARCDKRVSEEHLNENGERK